MTKRWKMVLVALAVALASAAAWGDLVIDGPRSVPLPWIHDSMERAMFGAGLGGAMVFVALLPALGALLMAGVRSGKVPRKGRVMDFVVWLILILVFLLAGAMFFGNFLLNLARQIPVGIWIASAGSAILAAVALIVGRHTKSRAWFVASAVVAASAIVFLACAAVNASPPPREEPPARPYHYYDGPHFNDDGIVSGGE